MARLKIELTRQEIEAACMSYVREKYETALRGHELFNITFAHDSNRLKSAEIMFTDEVRSSPQR